uniref:Globin domain-containing protein n=1 Tax=Leptobrachium leishanense TaxID=445787 RepID=A0A8C5N1D8_9ANUR
MPHKTDGMSTVQKEALRSFWDKIAPEAKPLGSEAMYRLLNVYPCTKSYFMHYDQSQSSPDLLIHGGKVMNAIGAGIKNIDHNLCGEMGGLPDLHTKRLRLEMEHFRFFSIVLQITLARNYPQDFDAELQNAWEKYLHVLSSVLLNIFP